MERLFARELPDHAHDLTWAPDGETLACATLAGAVVLVDARTGADVWASAGHEGGALAVAFSPDGERVATGGQDGRVRLLDAASGAEVRVLDAGARGEWVSQIVWPSREILACAAGRAVRFFSVEGELLGEIANLPSTVTSLFWHEGQKAWGATHYGGVSWLAASEAKPVRRMPYRGSILVARPSPHGRFVASGNQDATVRFWDLERDEDASLSGYPEKVQVLAWGPESTVLATAGGKDVVLWVCRGAVQSPVGTRPITLSHHARRIRGLAFGKTGETLLSSGEDGRICRWALVAGSPMAVVDEDRVPQALLAMAFDAPRGVVACAGEHGRLFAWRLDDG